MMANSDGFALQNALIDPYGVLSPQQQAIRIALYNEFRAHTVYRRVIESYGEMPPFAAIGQAKARHIEHLMTLFPRYVVPPVTDDWYPRVQVAPTWLANCELGVAGEIGNILLYDRLIAYVETEDVRDAFFRLQAASYNHHLPAFRSCVARHRYTAAPSQAGAGHASPNTNNLRHLTSWASQLWQQWQQGQFDPTTLPAQLQPLVNQLGGSFMWGTLAGAGLGAVFGSRARSQSSSE